MRKLRAKPVAGGNDAPLFRQIAHDYRTNVDANTAAALAYYALLALVPLLSLCVALFGAVLGGSHELSQHIEQLAADNMPGNSATITQSLHVVRQSPGLAGVAGLFGLFIPASGFFGALEPVLARMFTAPHKRSWLAGRAIGLLATVVTMAVLAGSLVVTSLVTWLQHFSAEELPAALHISLALNLVARLATPMVTVVLFAILYRTLPTVRVPVGPALLGGLIGGSLWELAKHLFALYITRIANFSMVFGSLGALVTIMVWAYYSAHVFLAGAQVAATTTRMKYKVADGEEGGM